jgi:hypothetical protein
MYDFQGDVSSYHHAAHQTYNPYTDASHGNMDDVTSRYEALFQEDAMDVFRRRQTSYRPNRSFHDVNMNTNNNQGYAEAVHQSNSFMVGHRPYDLYGADEDYKPIQTAELAQDAYYERPRSGDSDGFESANDDLDGMAFDEAPRRPL